MVPPWWYKLWRSVTLIHGRLVVVTALSFKQLFMVIWPTRLKIIQPKIMKQIFNEVLWFIFLLCVALFSSSSSEAEDISSAFKGADDFFLPFEGQKSSSSD